MPPDMGNRYSMNHASGLVILHLPSLSMSDSPLRVRSIMMP